MRQACRVCTQAKSTPSGLLRSSKIGQTARIANQRTTRRTYVSETKRDHASVNVDTTIRAEQKAFFQETGKLPEKQTVPGTSVNADAMMSPMAGENRVVRTYDISLTPSRGTEASYRHGRRRATYLPGHAGDHASRSTST